MPLTRRSFIAKTAAVGAGGLAIASVVPGVKAGARKEALSAPEWMTLLGKSEAGARDYAARVEGEIPRSLRGVLYRNGPGMFERGAERRRHLLDGDGLIQRLSIGAQGARYQNAFVQTQKFKDDEHAGRSTHGTWTTRRPGGFLKNLGGNVVSQGGVTVYPVNGRLLARDETGPNYDIDLENLSTRGHFTPVEGLEGVNFKAHSRIDPHTGDWLMVGQKYGRNMQIHAAAIGPDFKTRKQYSFETDRQVYLHDFFVTESAFVFVLHPCEFSPFAFLAGTQSFVDSLSWNPAAGNLVAVLPRDGSPVTFLEAPSAFMWHGLNAFEQKNALVLDFVGFDEPDHFIGEDALFFRLMDGKLGRAEQPGTLHRYTIDTHARTLREDILDSGNHEFPIIDPRTAMRQHRHGFYAVGGSGPLNSGVKRFDYKTGQSHTFDFGPSVHVGEPVFAPNFDGALDEGWLISQCLDGASKTSFFAVFDAQTVDSGPVAKIWLPHHVPISFHGAWVPAPSTS